MFLFIMLIDIVFLIFVINNFLIFIILLNIFYKYLIKHLIKIKNILIKWIRFKMYLIQHKFFEIKRHLFFKFFLKFPNLSLKRLLYQFKTKPTYEKFEEILKASSLYVVSVRFKKEKGIFE